MPELLTIDEKKRKALEVKERASDAYKRALLTAWRDGQVTATERFLVEELRKHLKITDAQHRALEEEILKKLAQDHMEFVRVYKGVLEIALSDGAISGPEEEILENLRRTFMISVQEHEELRAEVESTVCGPPRCEGREGLAD
jgi:tellurite resistance protein